MFRSKQTLEERFSSFLSAPENKILKNKLLVIESNIQNLETVEEIQSNFSKQIEKLETNLKKTIREKSENASILENSQNSSATNFAEANGDLQASPNTQQNLFQNALNKNSRLNKMADEYCNTWDQALPFLKNESGHNTFKADLNIINKTYKGTDKQGGTDGILKKLENTHENYKKLQSLKERMDPRYEKSMASRIGDGAARGIATAMRKKPKDKNELKQEEDQKLNQKYKEVKLDYDQSYADLVSYLDNYWPTVEKRMMEAFSNQVMRIQQKFNEVQNIFNDSYSQMKIISSTTRAPVFGYPIIAHMEDLASSSSKTQFLIPTPIQQAIQFFEKENKNYMKHEGIFRQPGCKKTVKKHREQFDLGNYESLNNTELDIYNVASFMGEYLRSLPVYLIDKELQEFLDQNLEMFITKPNRISNIFEHYYHQCAQSGKIQHGKTMTRIKYISIILIVLFKFLYKVSLESSSNKMTIDNIVICFTPTMFESCRDQLPGKNEQRILKLLIKNCEVLFSGKFNVGDFDEDQMECDELYEFVTGRVKTKPIPTEKKETKELKKLNKTHSNASTLSKKRPAPARPSAPKIKFTEEKIHSMAEEEIKEHLQGPGSQKNLINMVANSPGLQSVKLKMSKKNQINDESEVQKIEFTPEIVHTPVAFQGSRPKLAVEFDGKDSANQVNISKLKETSSINKPESSPLKIDHNILAAGLKSQLADKNSPNPKPLPRKNLATQIHPQTPPKIQSSRDSSPSHSNSRLDINNNKNYSVRQKDISLSPLITKNTYSKNNKYNSPNPNPNDLSKMYTRPKSNPGMYDQKRDQFHISREKSRTSDAIDKPLKSNNYSRDNSLSSELNGKSEPERSESIEPIMYV